MARNIFHSPALLIPRLRSNESNLANLVDGGYPFLAAKLCP